MAQVFKWADERTGAGAEGEPSNERLHVRAEWPLLHQGGGGSSDRSDDHGERTYQTSWV